MGKISKAKREQVKKLYKSDLKKHEQLRDTIENELEILLRVKNIDKNAVALLALRYEIYRQNSAILDQIKKKYRF